MRPQLAAVIAAVALAGLSLLHLYWGAVGFSGRSSALPEVDGRPVFLPSRAACFAVAATLLVAAYVLLVCAGHLPAFGLPWLGVVGSASVGAVLILRSVGDFRYVGFFKQARGSDFALLDTRVYSPLCLALGALALWAAFGPRR